MTPTRPYGLTEPYDPAPVRPATEGDPPMNRPDVEVNPPAAGHNTTLWVRGPGWAEETLPWLRGPA